MVCGFGSYVVVLGLFSSADQRKLLCLFREILVKSFFVGFFCLVGVFLFGWVFFVDVVLKNNDPFVALCSI